MQFEKKRILQSVAVSVVALAMCGITVLLVQQYTVVPQPSLANRIPADSIVMFLRAGSMEDIVAVDNLLQLESRLTTPLPALGSGSYELAIMERSGTWQWMLQTITYNDSHVTGPAADMLLAADADHAGALGRLPAFRRMTRHEVPAVWLRTDALPFSDSRNDMLLRAILSSYSHIQMNWSDAPTLTLLRNQRASLPAHPANVIRASSASGIHLADPALGMRIQEVMRALERDHPALREGIAGIAMHTWSETLGSDAADHLMELLPLLAGVHVVRSEGRLTATLVLQGADTGPADAMLDAFAAALPQTAVRDLVLQKDRRTDIAVDEYAVERGEEMVGRWRIVWARQREAAAGLAYAHNGNRMLISADTNLLRQMIEEDAQSEGAAPIVPQNGGSVDVGMLQEAATDLMPIFTKERTSLLWRLLDRNVRWTLVTHSEADILILEIPQE